MVPLVTGGRQTLLAGNSSVHLQPSPWEEMKSSQPTFRQPADTRENPCPRRSKRLCANVLLKHRLGELLRTFPASVFVFSSKTKQIYTLIIKHTKSHTHPALRLEYAFSYSSHLNCIPESLG